MEAPCITGLLRWPLTCAALWFQPGKPIDPKDMKAIEEIVVGLVNASLPVYAKEASLEEAKKIIGLRAVFGEVRKRRSRNLITTVSLAIGARV